jgi:hypothetical protein
MRYDFLRERLTFLKKEETKLFDNLQETKRKIDIIEDWLCEFDKCLVCEGTGRILHIISNDEDYIEDCKCCKGKGFLNE